MPLSTLKQKCAEKRVWLARLLGILSFCFTLVWKQVISYKHKHAQEVVRLTLLCNVGYHSTGGLFLCCQTHWQLSGSKILFKTLMHLSLSTGTPPTWGNPGATRGFRYHFFSKVPWLKSNSPPQGLNYIWLRGAHSCENCACAWAVT